MRRVPPQTWNDLGWRDKLRLRVPDILMLAVLLVLAGAYLMGRLT